MKLWLVAGSLLVAAMLFAGCCGICGITGEGGGPKAEITEVKGKNTGTTVPNGGTTTERVQSVYGMVENPGGREASTFKGKVVLEHNGERQYVTPTPAEEGMWEFRGDLVLRRGQNTIIVYIEDEDGNIVGQSEQYSVIGNFPPRQVEVVLTWNTDNNDLDMHVWSPNGEHAYFDELDAIPGCNLDLDDTDGYGPETFICETNNIENGQWTVKVRYFASHGVEEPVTATVRVRLNEGQTQTFTHTFTKDQANDGDASNDWTVITFNMP